jgi:hypothetical protein
MLPVFDDGDHELRHENKAIGHSQSPLPVLSVGRTQILHHDLYPWRVERRLRHLVCKEAMSG